MDSIIPAEKYRLSGNFPPEITGSPPPDIPDFLSLCYTTNKL